MAIINKSPVFGGLEGFIAVYMIIKKGIMTKEPIVFHPKPIGVDKKKNQNTTQLISKFRKVVEESGVLKEYRERRFYEKESERKRRAKKIARRNSLTRGN